MTSITLDQLPAALREALEARGLLVVTLGQGGLVRFGRELAQASDDDDLVHALATLPARQRDALAVFVEAAQDGRPLPTYREVGAALGTTSTNAVYDHVQALRRKGLLTEASRSASGGPKPRTTAPAAGVVASWSKALAVVAAHRRPASRHSCRPCGVNARGSRP